MKNAIPWVYLLAQFQGSWEVLSPAGAASELASEAGRSGAICTAAALDSPQKGAVFSESSCPVDQECQGATGIIYLLKGVKFNMYQHGIMHISRGKEGQLR